jgi:uncharacterized membrane protein YqjE
VGLGDTVARLGASSLSLVRQHLELAALDVEEELLRFGTYAALAIATALVLTLALAAAAATLVVVFWETARLTALVGVTAFFALVAALMAWILLRAIRSKPRLMAGTLSELDKSRAHWGTSR